MSDDHPRKRGIVVRSGVHLLACATGGGEMSICRECSEDQLVACRREGHISLEDAWQTVKAPARKSHWLSADQTATFRRQLADAACTKGWIEARDFYRLLLVFSFTPVWGPTRRKSLPDAMTAQVARDLGSAPDQEFAALEHLAVTLIDRAAGRYLEDDTEGKAVYRPETGKAFANYVYAAFRYAAMRALKKAERHILYADDPWGDREDTASDGGMGSAYSADEAMKQHVAATQEGELAVVRVHDLLREIAPILARAIARERSVLEKLKALLDSGAIRATPKKRESFERAIKIATAGLDGVPGYSIVLNSAIGMPSDAPQIILSTSITAGQAERDFGSTNATVFNEQIAGWIDQMLDLACDTDERAEIAGSMLGAMALREAAYALLVEVTHFVVNLFPGDMARRLDRWLGPPVRDRTDQANAGAGGAGGVGIANVPFAFGLIDPLGNQTRGLLRLLIGAAEADPPEIEP